MRISERPAHSDSTRQSCRSRCRRPAGRCDAGVPIRTRQLRVGIMLVGIGGGDFIGVGRQIFSGLPGCQEIFASGGRFSKPAIFLILPQKIQSHDRGPAICIEPSKNFSTISESYGRTMETSRARNNAHKKGQMVVKLVREIMVAAKLGGRRPRPQPPPLCRRRKGQEIFRHQGYHRARHQKRRGTHGRKSGQLMKRSSMKGLPRTKCQWWWSA